ncbi:uncharacterized protein LOC116433399 [Nomia melanderi]|uniref:uncharacterized protein LOC116433399 n=1 Tax=Nomia melanderi TaxID=2448451 RepID=UPI0013041CAD|nr:uncharacterized protein LOC116433399 [Nomia melanderi]
MRATFAILAVVALASRAAGQASTNWVDALTQNIHALTSDIQRNVGQLNQQIQQTVNTETARAHRLASNLQQGIGAGSVQLVGGGGNVVLTDDRGTRFVKSGRTSDGNAYVYESSSSIVGDTLRNEVTVRYPALNVSRAFGFTLDLKDVHAKPVPVDGSSF